MILVLDDHPLARQGLESVIGMVRPEETVLQAGTVKEAVRYMEKNPVRMVFVDINLGEESGFDFLEWMQKNGRQAKTFFITSSSRKSDFVYAKELGVDAYVLKDAFIDDIVYGLKVVERGGKFYSAALIEQAGKLSEEEKKLKELTEREKEVLALVSQGDSNAVISKKLCISEWTTKKHITSILGKLGVESRVGAVLFAEKNGELLQTAIRAGTRTDRRRRT